MLQHVLMYSHPYHQIFNDCLSIVFEYYIQEVNETVDSYPEEILQFFTRYIRCWEFGWDNRVSVKAFLERTRGKKHTLFYVYAVEHRIDSETFAFFRGIHELNIGLAGHTVIRTEPQFTNEDFANLRGIHKLYMAHRRHITDAAFVNLRGIHTLDMEGCSLVTDAALENLRGIHTLDIRGCPRITDSGLMNLRGIHSLMMDECPLVTDSGLVNLRGVKILCLGSCKWTDKGLENLRGVLDLALDCRQVTFQSFIDLRGITFLALENAHTDTIQDSLFENLIGLEELKVFRNRHCLGHAKSLGIRFVGSGAEELLEFLKQRDCYLSEHW